MTIVSLDRLLRGGRFVGSRGSKSRLGEFARICRRRRSCDSFPNRPYGQRMLSCPRGNEGMSEAIGVYGGTASLELRGHYCPLKRMPTLLIVQWNFGQRSAYGRPVLVRL